MWTGVTPVAAGWALARGEAGAAAFDVAVDVDRMVRPSALSRRARLQGGGDPPGWVTTMPTAPRPSAIQA
ncbi:MAG: hypothetical protein U0841_29430 [Chloroflexia bacterium]